MSTKIFYFSGTGNSFYVSKQLAEKLGDTEIISISKVKGNAVDTSCQKIGIVFPVYAWGPPRIVTEFVKNLNLKDKYVFSVATYGGFIGGTLVLLNNSIKEKGGKISAGFGLKQPGNYIVGYGNSRPSEEMYKKFAEKADTKLDQIAKVINNCEETKIEKNYGFVNAITNNIYKAFTSHLKQQEKGFWVNDNCNNCKICERICPVENIKETDGKRIWQGKCEQCMACIQWCPKEAIQYGKGTAKRLRYRHPEIKVEEMLNR
ncbi:MAG: EFR1 family ferrodoxin [Deltaproteobacteria bacterium]